MRPPFCVSGIAYIRPVGRAAAFCPRVGIDDRPWRGCLEREVETREVWIDMEQCVPLRASDLTEIGHNDTEPPPRGALRASLTPKIRLKCAVLGDMTGIGQRIFRGNHLPGKVVVLRGHGRREYRTNYLKIFIFC